MKHLIKYKLFENSNKLSIDDLDLIEVENFAIDYIDWNSYIYFRKLF